MKLLQIQAAIGTAILLLSSPCDAKHGHSHSLEVLGRRHNHLHHRQLHASRREESASVSTAELEKRGSCAFPTDKGLVAVTPDLVNAGWAMSPDEGCVKRTWCPFACPPGEVMNQWDPSAKTYSYPESMHGGLYCNENGEIEVPFPDRPYCVKGVGSVKADNRCKGEVSFCQTLLPGNEAMLVPTAVKGIETIAVPDTSYWASTAAHYYINTPGVEVSDACKWGTASKAVGNWAHYVAGANTDANGMTFVKIGWNPTIFETSLFKLAPPDFGLRIECDGPCVGRPCAIGGTDVGKVTSSLSATGAGGADFCVVTVPKGSTARIVVFPIDGEESSNDTPEDTPAPKVSTTPKPTPKPTPTPTPTPTPSPSSTVQPTTSSTSSSSSSSTSSSTSTSSSSSSSTLDESSSVNTTVPTKGGNAPHVLFQNQNKTESIYPTKLLATGTGSTSPATAVPVAPAATTTKNAADITVSSSFFSFAIALVAAGFFL